MALSSDENEAHAVQNRGNKIPKDSSPPLSFIQAYYFAIQEKALASCNNR